MTVPRHELQCTTCLQQMVPGVDELVYMRCCQNLNHKQCAEDWIKSHDTCPACSVELDIPREVDEDYDILGEFMARYEPFPILAGTVLHIVVKTDAPEHSQRHEVGRLQAHEGDTWEAFKAAANAAGIRIADGAMFGYQGFVIGRVYADGETLGQIVFPLGLLNRDDMVNNLELTLPIDQIIT